MQGILTTELSAPVEGASTVRETYCQPEGAQVRSVGSRREALQGQLYAMVSREVMEESNPAPPAPDYRSTTSKDFFRGGTGVARMRVYVCGVCVMCGVCVCSQCDPSSAMECNTDGTSCSNRCPT